jgi:hypothetical protein
MPVDHGPIMLPAGRLAYALVKLRCCVRHDHSDPIAYNTATGHDSLWQCPRCGLVLERRWGLIRKAAEQ